MAQVVFPAVVVPGSTADPSEPASPSDGQIWIDTDGTAPTTVVTRWSKTPTNGTTTLSGTDDTTNTLAYTPGYEQVFLNGVLLSRGSDYTATTGTSVVLVTATVTNDIVEIIAALQVAYTDAITTTAAASTYVAKALTTTTGDIIYASAANTPARLGIGSSAQVLTVASGIPSWATPSSGGTFTTFTPAARTGIIVGNGTETAVTASVGNLQYMYYKFLVGSTSTINGTVGFSPPSGMSPTYSALTALNASFYDTSATTLYDGVSYYHTNGYWYPKVLSTSSTYSTLIDSNTTIPFNWNTGDYFIIEGWYRV